VVIFTFSLTAHEEGWSKRKSQRKTGGIFEYLPMVNLPITGHREFDLGNWGGEYGVRISLSKASLMGKGAYS